MEKSRFKWLAYLFIIGFIFSACGDNSKQQSKGAFGDQDAASQVYVSPGEYDEFYAFMSGGFSGQVSVYGLPSGDYLK